LKNYGINDEIVQVEENDRRRSDQLEFETD